MALPLVDRERLLGDRKRGGWKIKPAAGRCSTGAGLRLWARRRPAGARCGSGTWRRRRRRLPKPDPDFTAGVLMRRVGDVYYVLGAIAEQAAPGRVDGLMRNTATQDGNQVAVRFEREGAPAGARCADDGGAVGRLRRAGGGAAGR